MRIDLYAIGTRFTKIAAVAALVLASVLIATPSAARAASATPTTTVLAQGTGMTGAPSVRVRIVQHALRQRGLSLGPAGVDGRFGPRTAAAVRRFQARKGLAVDGIVGRSTRTSLGLSRVETRGGTKPARGSQSRARRHRNTPTKNAETPGPASPSTAVPAAAPTRTTPTPPSTVQAPARRPAAMPTALTPDHNGTGWAAPLAIGAIAAFLIIAASPLFLDSALPRRHRARRARKAAALARRAAPPDRTTATRPTNGVAIAAFAVAGSKGRENGRPARPRATGTSTAGRKKQSVSPGVNGNDTAPLAPGDAVLGYVWVTEERRAASIRAIRDACGREGWSLVDVVSDRANGDPRRHPNLTAVLERIAAGEIGGIVIGHESRGNGSATESAGLDIGSLAGPDFTLHHLGVDAEACDVALIAPRAGARQAVGL